MPPSPETAQNGDLNGTFAREKSLPTTLAIDAMSGDSGPETVIQGLAIAAKRRENLEFKVFGDADAINRLLNDQRELAPRVEIVPCDGVVPMDVQPSKALRGGRDSSMWRAIDAVGDGAAAAALSAGNTGALMTMAMVRLRPVQSAMRSGWRPPRTSTRSSVSSARRMTSLLSDSRSSFAWNGQTWTPPSRARARSTSSNAGRGTL